MKTFEWNRNFETGIARVDSQHRRLVDLINKLGASMVGADSQAPVGNGSDLKAVFSELTDYAREHFADEEALSEQAGVDIRHREQHHNHHVEFVRQLSSLWNSRRLVSDAPQALHDFLCSWLAFHILGEDMVLARQISLIREGSSPEAAFASSVAGGDDGRTGTLLAALGNLYQVLTQQNGALVMANTLLEQRVADRTAELQQANQSLRELNLRLQALSSTDGLLGIANRRHFDERLDMEWQRALRQRQVLSLLMIDIDHFKLYNDTYGHMAGDECLKSVSQAIGGQLKRATDLLARYGGEELAVILPGVEAAGAAAVAQRILEAIREARIAHASSPVSDRVTVSIGVASVVPTGDGSRQGLINDADRALYRAKGTGRNRLCVHDAVGVEGA